MEALKIYGFADEISPMLDLQIRGLEENGLDGIEIRNADGKGIADVTLEEAREIRKKLDAHGLVTWSVASPIGKIGIDAPDMEKHMDTFRHILDLAATLGAPNIRLFSFYMPDGKDPTAYAEKVVEILGQMCDMAGGYYVNLCHENEKKIFGDTPERCAFLLSALPKLKCVFDPANFVQCGADTLQAWDLLKEKVCYLHIKDANADGTVVPPGEGIGNLRQIAEDYRKRGGVHVTMEPHLVAFGGLAALEKEGGKSGILSGKYGDPAQSFRYACRAFENLTGGK